MTWACLVGLFEEWTGDAHLVTGDAGASRYYDRAGSWYRAEGCREATLDRRSPAPCWQWGHEPEFDGAWAALGTHLDWVAPAAAPDPTADYEVYTFDRLAYKRDLVEALTR
jgi:hypothetical protein